MPLPALAAAGAWLGANPLAGAALANLGYSMYQGLFGGQSELERLAQQQTGVGQTLIPQLQQAAAGQPTAATRAQMGQLRQQATKMGQSYAASAQSRGVAGTTPSAAQQGRIQAAELQGQANILGQAQVAATQQLAGIYGQGVATQIQADQIKRQAKTDFLEGIGTFMGWYNQNRNDPQAQRMYKLVEEEASLLTGGGTTAGAGIPQPAWPPLSRPYT